MSLPKKILVFFLSIVFLTTSYSLISAQEPTSATENPSSLKRTINGVDPDDPDPEKSKLYIDGNNKIVKIMFEGLGGDGEFFLCPRSDQTACRLQPFNLRKKNSSGGKIELDKLCGAGEDTLKGSGIGKSCKEDGNDYFHEGHMYGVSVFDDKEGQAGIIGAQFFVRHSTPTIKIVPKNKRGPTTIDVFLSGTRPGGDKKNNYQVVLEGIRGTIFDKEDRCKTVTGKTPTIKMKDQKQEEVLGGSATDGTKFTFPKEKKDGGKYSTLYPGSYVLKINEQVKEGGAKKLLAGNDSCNGGFTYAHVFFTIENVRDFHIDRFDFDPNDSDFEKEKKTFDSPDAPCLINKTTQLCDKIDTAIGTINITPQGFVSSLFSVILTIAGTGALILITYSGYVFMTSRGDKEKVAAARETLTSAILGLLFIIFSIVILETIGVDILKIPGLAR